MRALAVLAAGAAPAARATGGSTTSEVPADAASCTWPQCTYKCRCKNYDPVGSCAVSLVIPNFSKVPDAFNDFEGCAPDRGPTECFLGKCLCKEGFCASEDGESCEPEVCVPGATAPQYEPTDYWMGKFYDLASSDRFPPPGTTKSEALVFVRENALWPAALIVLGLIVGILTFVCLCLSPGIGDKRGMKVSRRPVSPASRKMLVEPSLCPMLSVAGLTLVLNVVLIVQRSATYARTAGALDETVAHLLRDVTTVQQQAGEINRTVRGLQHRLEDAPQSCAGVGDQTKEMLADRTRSAVSGYCDQVENFTKQIQPLPAEVKEVQGHMQDFFPFLKWGPVLPVLVMTLANVLMVIEAFLTRVYGTSTLAREEDFAMHVAAVIFFLVILIVAVISAAEVSVGIAASLFCNDVDENVQQYAAFYVNQMNTSEGNRQMMVNLTKFYISGGLPSPVGTKLRTLLKYFKALQEYYNSAMVQDNAGVPAALCPALSEISMREDLLMPAKGAMDSMLPLIKTSNIFPYYDRVVHDMMCGSVVETLGWTVVTQAIVGFICFPACAVLTHRFLSSWAVWKSRTEQASEDMFDDMHEATGKFRADDAEGFSSESDDEVHCFGVWRGGRRENGEARDSQALISPRHQQSWSR